MSAEHKEVRFSCKIHAQETCTVRSRDGKSMCIVRNIAVYEREQLEGRGIHSADPVLEEEKRFHVFLLVRREMKQTKTVWQETT